MNPGPRPLDWLVLGLAAGIRAGTALGVGRMQALALGATSPLIAFAAVLVPRRLRGVVLLVAGAAAGVLGGYSAATELDGSLVPWVDREVALVGVVAGVEQRAAGWSATVDAEEVGVPGLELGPAQGRVVVSAWGQAEPSPGERVRLRGVLRRPDVPRNPGGFDERRFLATKRGAGYVLAVRSWETVGHPPNRVAALVEAVRGKLLRGTAAVVPPKRAELVVGIAWGEDSAVSAETREQFRRAGLAHLLAVSGSNVALVVAGLMVLWARAGLPVRLFAGVGTAAVAAYAVLAGGEVPILRAAVSTAFLLWVPRSGRRPDGRAAVAVAALILLGANPRFLDDVAFQLSAGASWGLVALGPRVAVWLRPLASRGAPRAVVDVLAASVAAQLAIFPVLLEMARSAQPWGPVVNVAAIPLAGLVAGSGIVAGVLAAAGLGAAALLAGTLAGGAAGALEAVAALGAALPGADLVTPALPWPLAAAYYVALAMGVASPGRAASGALAAAAALAVAWVAVPPATPGPQLVFLDVGQGDAAVAGAEGAVGAVDTGRDGRELAGFLRGAGVRRLAFLALSHPHEDHAGGAARIVEEFRPREVWLGGDAAAPGYRGVIEAARRFDVPVKAPVPGEALDLHGVRVETAANGTRADGLEIAQDEENRAENDASLILRVVIPHGPVVLFTGDLEATGEAALLHTKADLKAGVLKVGHHGSRSSSSESFLSAVGPEVAVVSVGRNPWGMPHAEVLGRLGSAGGEVLRTDRRGAVGWIAGRWWAMACEEECMGDR